MTSEWITEGKHVSRAVKRQIRDLKTSINDELKDKLEPRNTQEAFKKSKELIQILKENNVSPDSEHYKNLMLQWGVSEELGFRKECLTKGLTTYSGRFQGYTDKFGNIGVITNDRRLIILSGQYEDEGENFFELAITKEIKDDRVGGFSRLYRPFREACDLAIVDDKATKILVIGYLPKISIARGDVNYRSGKTTSGLGYILFSLTEKENLRKEVDSIEKYIGINQDKILMVQPEVVTGAIKIIRSQDEARINKTLHKLVSEYNPGRALMHLYLEKA